MRNYGTTIFLFLLILQLSCSEGPADIPEPDLDQMILIPGGRFIMGSDQNWREEPSHEVDLDDFYIDKYEVTEQEYDRFVKETGHRVPKYWQKRGGEPRKGSGLLPVAYVDYYDACAYCEWEGKRLPTEAEWEKAARGTDGRNYPWGDEWDPDFANTWEKGEHRRAPVNSYPQGVSPYGVYNMGGNVWEWTSSWFINYEGASAQLDLTDSDIVLKGGSWLDFADSTRPSLRHEFTPYLRFNTVGFRCAKDAGDE